LLLSTPSLHRVQAHSRYSTLVNSRNGLDLWNIVTECHRTFTRRMHSPSLTNHHLDDTNPHTLQMSFNERKPSHNHRNFPNKSNKPTSEEEKTLRHSSKPFTPQVKARREGQYSNDPDLILLDTGAQVSVFMNESLLVNITTVDKPVLPNPISSNATERGLFADCKTSTE
jgi:hypothetical protein